MLTNNLLIKRADIAFIKKYKNQIFDLLKCSIKVNLTDINNLDIFIKNRLLLMEKSLTENTAIIYFAEKENILIGFAWSYLKDKLAKEVHITDVVVNDKFQNYKIGTFLLNKTENYCKEKNYKSITLMVSSDNLVALHLYEKLGYIEQRKLLRKVINR